MNSFRIAATPNLHAGAGALSALPGLVAPWGKQVLLVTGAHSFTASPASQNLLQQLHDNGNVVNNCHIDREPTPAMIDDIVVRHRDAKPNVVVAIGGGSVLDAGKAIAAMLPLGAPVKDYLEGVGTKQHPGVTVAFVAVPTTSGTGSEATKNAVLSEVGPNGYKKSLRHDNFVPNAAILDPALSATCPPHVTAASGMDAFTQLLESYLSTEANAITDALAVEGLQHIAASLVKVYHDGYDIDARMGMALASYLSGFTLANAGLGVVHGFASAIGGYFPIAHGVICSRLMPAANIVTVRRLRSTQSNPLALKKYARVGQLFTTTHGKADDYYIDALLAVIHDMVESMNIPTLSQTGVTPVAFQKIVKGTGNKNNPATLSPDELEEILTLSL